MAIDTGATTREKPPMWIFAWEAVFLGSGMWVMLSALAAERRFALRLIAGCALLFTSLLAPMAASWN